MILPSMYCFKNEQDCFVRSETAKGSQVDLDPIKHNLLVLLLNSFKNIPQNACPELESRQLMVQNVRGRYPGGRKTSWASLGLKLVHMTF